MLKKYEKKKNERANERGREMKNEGASGGGERPMNSSNLPSNLHVSTFSHNDPPESRIQNEFIHLPPLSFFVPPSSPL